MSDASHIIVLIAAAVVITALLTIGPLAAAGLLPGRPREER